MNQAAQVPEITCLELKARLDAGDVPVLVDVRDAFELSIADLPASGQKHIPTGEFASRMEELDPADEIVVYCRSGGRSEWAAGLLINAGFTSVYNLRGGVLGWRAEVDPSLTAY